MFFNVFYSILFVFILKIFKFTSSAVFKTNILLGKSLRALRLLLHLPKLAINDNNEVHLNFNQKE